MQDAAASDDSDDMDVIGMQRRRQLRSDRRPARGLHLRSSSSDEDEPHGDALQVGGAAPALGGGISGFGARSGDAPALGAFGGHNALQVGGAAPALGGGISGFGARSGDAPALGAFGGHNALQVGGAAPALGGGISGFGARSGDAPALGAFGGHNALQVGGAAPALGGGISGFGARSGDAPALAGAALGTSAFAGGSRKHVHPRGDEEELAMGTLEDDLQLQPPRLTRMEALAAAADGAKRRELAPAAGPGPALPSSSGLAAATGASGRDMAAAEAPAAQQAGAPLRRLRRGAAGQGSHGFQPPRLALQAQAQDMQHRHRVTQPGRSAAGVSGITLGLAAGGQQPAAADGFEEEAQVPSGMQVLQLQLGDAFSGVASQVLHAAGLPSLLPASAKGPLPSTTTIG